MIKKLKEKKLLEKIRRKVEIMKEAPRIEWKLNKRIKLDCGLWIVNCGVVNCGLYTETYM